MACIRGRCGIAEAEVCVLCKSEVYFCSVLLCRTQGAAGEKGDVLGIEGGKGCVAAIVMIV